MYALKINLSQSRHRHQTRDNMVPMICITSMNVTPHYSGPQMARNGFQYIVKWIWLFFLFGGLYVCERDLHIVRVLNAKCVNWRGCVVSFLACVHGCAQPSENANHRSQSQFTTNCTSIDPKHHLLSWFAFNNHDIHKQKSYIATPRFCLFQSMLSDIFRQHFDNASAPFQKHEVAHLCTNIHMRACMYKMRWT